MNAPTFASLQNKYRRITFGWVFFLLFVGTVFLANWLVSNVGVQLEEGGPHLLPIFSLMVPSGVLAVGLGFTLRDLVQRNLGTRYSAIAVLIGAGLSALLSPALALASGASFLISELLDLGVYTPLRKKNLMVAVIASNLVGLVVDSILFLTLAFGMSSLTFLPGQIIGKLLMTILVLPIVWVIDRQDRARAVAWAQLNRVIDEELDRRYKA